MDSNVSQTILNTTNINVTSGYVPQTPAFILALTTICYILIFTIGLFGNIAVITVVIRCRTMRTIFNILFLNLCVADLLVLLITGPTAVIDIYAREVWYLGKTMCKLIPFLENVVGHASALTILAICVERYRVAFSLNHQRSKKKLLITTFVGIWLSSVLSASPSVLITQYKKHKLLDGTPVKVCSTPIYLVWHKIYIVLTTGIFFFLPLLAIIIMYAKVCCKLVYLYKKERQRFETSPIEIIKLKRQMIQIIVTVVMVFFICHTPYRAVVIWTLFEKTETLRNFGFEAYLTVLYFTRILLYANHAINPFVYNFVSRKFRRALKWICCHHQNKNISPFTKIKQHEHQSSLRNVSNRRPDPFLYLGYQKASCRSREGSHRDKNHINDFLALYKHLVLLEDK